jgi:ABC-type uncharacterized transport system permease subunit
MLQSSEIFTQTCLKLGIWALKHPVLWERVSGFLVVHNTNSLAFLLLQSYLVGALLGFIYAFLTVMTSGGMFNTVCGMAFLIVGGGFVRFHRGKCYRHRNLP